MADVQKWAVDVMGENFLDLDFRVALMMDWRASIRTAPLG
jgi:hypothetical protein